MFFLVEHLHMMKNLNHQRQGNGKKSNDKHITCIPCLHDFRITHRMWQFPNSSVCCNLQMTMSRTCNTPQHLDQVSVIGM